MKRPLALLVAWAIPDLLSLRAGQEIETDGKVAAEAEKLYQFVCEQVKKFRSEHAEQATGGDDEDPAPAAL